MYVTLACHCDILPANDRPTRSYIEMHKLLICWYFALGHWPASGEWRVYMSSLSFLCPHLLSHPISPQRHPSLLSHPPCNSSDLLPSFSSPAFFRPPLASTPSHLFFCAFANITLSFVHMFRSFSTVSLTRASSVMQLKPRDWLGLARCKVGKLLLRHTVGRLQHSVAD